MVQKIILLLLLVWSCAGCTVAKQPPPQVTEEMEMVTDASVEVSPDQTPLTPQPFVAHGIVTPHHLVAKSLIETALDTYVTEFGESMPQLIILMSPNHSTHIPEEIMTTQRYGESLKNIPVPTELINQLVADHYLQTANNDLSTEHGLFAVLPYINSTFKGAPVLSLVYSRNTDAETAVAMADAIEAYCKTNGITQILWYLSSDFSHGQTPLVAEQNDAHLQSLIENKSYKDLIPLSAAYSDAPVPLYLLMERMAKHDGALTWIDHTNSGILLNKLNITNTTSYFTFIW